MIDDGLAGQDDGSSSLEPTGASEEYGLPVDSKPHERERWERQERYLRAFAKQGNHTRVCQGTGIARDTSIYWEERNVYHFNERLKLAKEKHRELLESEHIFGPLEAASARDKLLHPVLPIFALKGAWPEKYGDKVSFSDNSGIIGTLKALEKLGAQNRVERGLQAPATDAEVREMKPGEDTR